MVDVALSCDDVLEQLGVGLDGADDDDDVMAPLVSGRLSVTKCSWLVTMR